MKNINELIPEESKNVYTISVDDTNELIELAKRFGDDYIIIIDRSKNRIRVSRKEILNNG